jgi:hypothetical protein
MNLHKITGILLCLAVLLFAACRKDLGNYNYHDINEASITGIDSSYIVLRGLPLKITPQLNFTQDQSGDTTKYAYQWFAMDPLSAPAIRYDLATTRNLDWRVSLPSLDLNYKVYYIVTEKSTGMQWRRIFDLKVTTNIADGWLVLNQTSSGPRLDYFNYLKDSGTFQYYKDILAAQGSIKLSGNAKNVYFYQRRDGFTGKFMRAVVVSTDEYTKIFNTQNNVFTDYVDMSKATAAYFPPPFYAEKVAAIGSMYMSYMLDNRGNVSYESPIQGITWGSAVNRTITGEKISISRHLAESYRNVYNYILMYDTVKKRFVQHQNMDVSSSVPATDSKLFDPGNVNMDLMYMASTPAISGRTYAVLKDNAGKVWLAIIKASGEMFVEQDFFEIKSTDIASAGMFAIDPTEGYLMYSVGSKVYRFNPFDKTYKEVLDYGDRKITVLKYQKMVYLYTSQRYMEYASKLIVGSYKEGDETSGKVDFYTVPNLNGDLTLWNSFGGLSKVVDVSYRE